MAAGSSTVVTTILGIDAGTLILAAIALLSLLISGPIALVLRNTVRDQNRLERRQDYLEQKHDKAVDLMHERHNELRDYVHLKAATRDEQNSSMTRIEGLLRDISTKLGDKADRHELAAIHERLDQFKQRD